MKTTLGDAEKLFFDDVIVRLIRLFKSDLDVDIGNCNISLYNAALSGLLISCLQTHVKDDFEWFFPQSKYKYKVEIVEGIVEYEGINYSHEWIELNGIIIDFTTPRGCKDDMYYLGDLYSLIPLALSKILSAPLTHTKVRSLPWEDVAKVSFEKITVMETGEEKKILDYTLDLFHEVYLEE